MAKRNGFWRRGKNRPRGFGWQRRPLMQKGRPLTIEPLEPRMLLSGVDPYADLLARVTPHPHPTGDQPDNGTLPIVLSDYTPTPAPPDHGIPALEPFRDALQQIKDDIAANADARPSYWGEGGTSGGAAYRLHLNDNGMLIGEWVVDWGDGSDPQAVASQAWVMHQYPSGLGQYVVTVTAQGANGTYSLSGGGPGNHATSSQQNGLGVTVLPASPMLHVAGDQQISDAQTFSLNNLVAFTYPNSGSAEDFDYAVDWGDGSVWTTDTMNVSAPSNAALLLGALSDTHSYAAAGTFYVAVTVFPDASPDNVDTQTIRVDVSAAPPVVSEITCSDAEGIDASTVHFAVGFSKPVTGVDASDFVLELAGTTGTIDSVTGTGTEYGTGYFEDYTVTVSGVSVTDWSRTGTLGLDLIDDGSITDASGNPLGGPVSGDGGFIGGVYTIDTRLYWDGGSNDAWNTAHWRLGDLEGDAQYWVDGSDAYFLGSSGTITIAEGETVVANSLTFLGDDWTLEASGSGALLLGQYGTTVNVEGTSATISAPITGQYSCLAKIGGGTLILEGFNGFGSTELDDGTLTVGNSAALGGWGAGLSINGGVLDLNGCSITVGSLSGYGGVVTDTNGTAGTSTLEVYCQAVETTYYGCIEDGPVRQVAFVQYPASEVSLAGNETTTVLNLSPDSVSYGQQVTLVATVAVSGASSGTPTGFVQFCDGGSGTPFRIAPLNGSAQATCTVSALFLGTRQIMALYRGDNHFSSSMSDVQWVSTAARPATPADLTATAVSDTEIDLTWTDNANNETGYSVERMAVDGTWSQLVALGVGATTYEDTGLDEGTLYEYRVQATGTLIDSAYSALAYTTTLPAAPTSLSVTSINGSEVGLSWEDNSSVETGFSVEQFIDDDWQPLGATVASEATSATIAGSFAASTQYSFRVRACGQTDYGDDQYSLWSNTATAAEGSWPAPPSDLAATAVSDTEIDLAWTDNASGATYKIERSGDNATWTQIATTDADATGYADSGLTVGEGTPLYYRVRATSANGDSAYCSAANATTLLAAPTVLQVTAPSGAEMDLAWDDNSGLETGYSIEQYIDGDWQEVARAPAEATSQAVVGTFAPLTSYSFRVLAYSESAENEPYFYLSSAPSPTGTQTTVGWPAAPTDAGATPVSTSEIDLVWTDNATNETGYQIDRSLDGDTWTLLTTTLASAESYADTGLDEGTPYYYRICAVNYTGVSGYGVAAAPTLLATPTDVEATVVSGSRIDLEWVGHSTIASGYSIEQYIDTDWVEVASAEAEATSQSVLGTFEALTQYRFRVVAWSEYSVSLPSDEATASTPEWVAPPTGLTLTVVSGTEIDLSWTGSTGASGYVVEAEIADSDAWTALGTVTSPQTTFTATGLSPGGTEYAFRVASTSTTGTSKPCSAASAQTVNATPTVATGASAADNPVTTTSTTLSVLGADDGGESNLTYTWSVTSAPGGGDALFDDGNETNEAKNIGVAFTIAGAYQLSVTIKDALGSSVITSVNVTVAQTLTSITVSPGDAAVLPGASQQFSASGEDQFGNNLATQPAFTWYIDNDGPGSIDGNGMYTAPNETSESGCTIRAEGQAQAGTANVALRQRVATYVPLYAEEAPLSIQTVNLSQYLGVTRIEVTTPDPYGLHYDDFSFDDSWGHMVIDFNNLATGTVVTDQYGSAVFNGGTVSNDWLYTHVYQPPGGWTGTLVVDFREPVDNLRFSTGWIDTTPPEQFATVEVFQETALLELAVSDDNNSANCVRAVDAAIRDLYVPESDHNAVNIASLFTPMTFGVNGTGRDIHVTVKAGNSGTYLVNQDLREGGSLDDVQLKAGPGVRDCAITAWLDQNGNGVRDTGEEQREVDAHLIDLDTDSNNDGEIDHKTDHPVENKAGEPGKRIFVNTDDDNKNGKPDTDDATTAYTNANATDNDFAEIKVLGDLPAGYEVQLRCSDGLSLHSGRGKESLTLSRSADGWIYKWTSGRLFAEGTKVGPQTVTWWLFDTAKKAKIGPEHVLKINVEEIVYPFKNQAADWSKQDTSQWKGLKVGEAWYIDKALVDYITHPNVADPKDQGNLETRRPDLPGNVASALAFDPKTNPNVDSTSSNVTYANGFTMEFDYSFAKDHGDPATGYVQAGPRNPQQPIQRKISFVGNSGVKFGTTGDGKEFEINIIDVKSVWSLANGFPISAFIFNKRGEGAVRPVAADGTKFERESVNTVMNGVRYNGDYTSMPDWGNVAAPATRDDYRKILVNNASHGAGRMRITVARDAVTGTFTVDVGVSLDRGKTYTITYHESGISMVPAPPRLQSHWGSGVVFRNVTIT